MINNNNLCMFEGRTTQNTKFSQFTGSQGPVDKAFFSISVPRALTSDQRTKIKAGDTTIKQNDFVQCSLIGGQVKTLQNYFPAGTPIKILARYTEYTKTDATTGVKTYGHCFEVENISFVISPSQNQGGNNNNAAANRGGGNYQQPANNGYQQPANNGYQAPNAQQNQTQPAQPQNNFEMFPEQEYPF